MKTGGITREQMTERLVGRLQKDWANGLNSYAYRESMMEEARKLARLEESLMAREAADALEQGLALAASSLDLGPAQRAAAGAFAREADFTRAAELLDAGTRAAHVSIDAVCAQDPGDGRLADFAFTIQAEAPFDIYPLPWRYVTRITLPDGSKIEDEQSRAPGAAVEMSRAEIEKFERSLAHDEEGVHSALYLSFSRDAKRRGGPERELAQGGALALEVEVFSAPTPDAPAGLSLGLARATGALPDPPKSETRPPVVAAQAQYPPLQLSEIHVTRSVVDATGSVASHSESERAMEISAAGKQKDWSASLKLTQVVPSGM
jgi:hypothetical protein